ncbi:hypothetical protein CPC08DRAFT_419600 [Agrocybe pediades]|nr:hypothetical protein CPC08DRAFT_419600 [Agrocybe pediades]
MSDNDLDCTFDTNQGQGECHGNSTVDNAVLESGGFATVVPTTTQLSWTGSLLPAATITSVSSAAIPKGNFIASSIIALVVALVVAFA